MFLYLAQDEGQGGVEMKGNSKLGTISDQATANVSSN